MSSSIHEFEFERSGADGFDLRIRGELPLGWSAMLASNLSHRRFDVDTATATQAADGTWEGRVHGKRPMGVSSFPSAAELLTPPIEHAAPVKPSVHGHSIDLATDRKSLEVSVRAADAVGLLATLLRNFGMLGLFPRSFDVRTVAGEADDRFMLSSIGGSAVSERAATELERTLARWHAPSFAAHAQLSD